MLRLAASATPSTSSTTSTASPPGRRAGRQAGRAGRCGAAGRAAPGIYHGTSAGQTTWYGLARAVFAEAGLDPERVRPTTSDRVPAPGPAPGLQRARPRPLGTVRSGRPAGVAGSAARSSRPRSGLTSRHRLIEGGLQFPRRRDHLTASVTPGQRGQAFDTRRAAAAPSESPRAPRRQRQQVGHTRTRLGRQERPGSAPRQTCQTCSTAPASAASCSAVAARLSLRRPSATPSPISRPAAR